VSFINVLIVTEWDNGGQMYALYRALDLYTEHKARLITFKQSYLNYDTDVFDPNLDKVNVLVGWADFFILGEILQPRMHTAPILARIRPDNCIVRAGGSTARIYPQYYMTNEYRKIMKTGAFHDHTITSRIFPMAPTVNMYHFQDFPPKKHRVNNGRLKIVFSGTALKQKNEHSGEFMKAWEILSKKYPDDLELINIRNTSWKETLKIKAGCDICFDQLSIGTYANSAIEGMYYYMPTLAFVSAWSQTVHPDAPIVNVKTSGEIIDRIEGYIDNRNGMIDIGWEGHNYVVNNHSDLIAIKKWEALIKYVSEEYLK